MSATLIENVRIRLSWVPPGHAKDAHADLDALAARVQELETALEELETEAMNGEHPYVLAGIAHAVLVSQEPT